jgi:PAS domain S-box-containing protein
MENNKGREIDRSVVADERTALPAVTILVVDDHAPSRQFLTALLSYKNYRLLEASDGMEALAIARAERPDLILSDVLMPTMDGYEFVRQLRNDPLISRTTVVFCIAVYHVEQARTLAAACGVFHIICKPAEPETVLRIVTAALTKAPPTPPALPEEFDREHLKLVTNKLFKKVSQLEQVTIRNSEILDIARRLASEENSEQLLRTLCSAARKFTGARFAAVGLVRPGEPLLESFFVAGVELQTDDRSQPPAISVGFLDRLCRSPGPLRVGDIAGDPIALGFPPAYGSARPLLGTPLCSGGVLYGVLYVIEKLGADGFSEQDEKIVTSLAAQATVANENQQRLEKVKQYSVELRRTEEQLRHLAENVPEVFFVIALEPVRITYLSPAYEKIWLRPRQEVYDNPEAWLDDVHPEDRNRVKTLFEECLQGNLTVFEYRLQRSDGSVRHIHARSFPVSNEEEKCTCIVGIAQDVTERIEREAALNTAVVGAEAANRAKSEFLANMSHELRTPMNGIIGMTDLLLDTELSPEQAEYLQMVKGSADSLLTLLNDILDFSKMEAGKLDLDYLSFDVRKSLVEVIKTLAIKAQEKGLEFIFDVSPDVPANVFSDPARLRQVLVNLIANSLKFTETGEIEVTARTESQNADWVILRFSVRDTGMGIPANKQNLIFDAFSQADSSTTRKFGGSGLGLTISSQLVGMMGGTIRVESELGKGSTFHFTIHAKQGVAASPLEPFGVAQLAGVPVLIVDDNATNRRILEDSTVRWKMIPTVVENATAALQVLPQRQLSNAQLPLLLTDAHMPEIDGFGLVERIRQDPSLAEVRIVILTSGGQRGDAARCQKLGVAAYLSKPFDRLELRDILLHVLAGDPPAAGTKAPLTRHTVREQQRVLSFLVAEDNVINQKLIARLLEKRGHTVVLAQNGREALEVLEKQSFDIVLMDGQMPEMDGFEATKRIREKEKTNGTHLPIIALTAHAMQGDRERCLANGMDAYVSKPINVEELFAVVESVVLENSHRSDSRVPSVAG